VERLHKSVAHACRELLGEPVNSQDWEDLRTFSYLTNHEVMDNKPPDSEQGGLSWRHKGWMEFFLGVFLAHCCSPEVVAALQPHRIKPNLNALPPDQRDLGFIGLPAPQGAESTAAGRKQILFDVLSQLAIDPQCEWGWRFAIQWTLGDDNLRRHSLADNSLRWSLGALFRQPPRGRRPTRLMYEAFPLLEADPGPLPVRRQEPRPRSDLQPVLQAFRAELEQISQSGRSPAADLARALRSAGPDSTEYVPCPPPNWRFVCNGGRSQSLSSVCLISIIPICTASD